MLFRQIKKFILLIFPTGLLIPYFGKSQFQLFEFTDSQHNSMCVDQRWHLDKMLAYSPSLLREILPLQWFLLSNSLIHQLLKFWDYEFALVNCSVSKSQFFRSISRKHISHSYKTKLDLLLYFTCDTTTFVFSI